MAERPQQQTLSVRITEQMRRRLERARKLMSEKLGENVTTSEIAKQLLESARENRLEIVDLLEDSTKSLREMRQKVLDGNPLSQAEWAVLAHFVQQGIEAITFRLLNTLTRQALAEVLEAFLAAYELRAEPDQGKNSYYLKNLIYQVERSMGSKQRAVTAEFVRRVVRENVGYLSNPETSQRVPLYAGRNLYVLLEEEQFKSIDALNDALRPHWLALWKLAARGHFIIEGEPIREKWAEEQDSVFRSPIPPMKEGGFTLSFSRGEGHDFSLLLSFPGTPGPLYPVDSIPLIAEFRSMLMDFGPESKKPRWVGNVFFAYLAAENGETQVWFRATENGITFGFSPSEWACLQELFRRAWESPEVAMLWEELTLEYGEL
jgi:hypothetical protein